MKHPTQSSRHAAFYALYELVHFGRRTRGERYTSTRADEWGSKVGLLPIPAARASESEILAWERKLDALNPKPGALEAL